MGKIGAFLQETFRSPTPEERNAIRRYRNQRLVVSLATVAVLVLVLGVFLLTRAAAYQQLAGTWVAQADYTDGFHRDDVYLEFRNGAFYRSGSLYGRLQNQDGEQVMLVHSALGQYSCQLHPEGDRLEIEYTPPRVATVYTGSSFYAGATGLTGERVVDVYIRISKDSNLTAQEREQLY